MEEMDWLEAMLVCCTGQSVAEQAARYLETHVGEDEDAQEALVVALRGIVPQLEQLREAIELGLITYD